MIVQVIRPSGRSRLFLSSFCFIPHCGEGNRKWQRWKLSSERNMKISLKSAPEAARSQSTIPWPFSVAALRLTGLWAGNYMVLHKESAPAFVANHRSEPPCSYLGITISRFCLRFYHRPVGDKIWYAWNSFCNPSGAVLFLLPMGNAATLTGLILARSRLRTVYPSFFTRLRRKNWGAEIFTVGHGDADGLRLCGDTLMPPCGFCVRQTVSDFIVLLLLFVAGMFTMTEGGWHEPWALAAISRGQLNHPTNYSRGDPLLLIVTVQP